MRADSKSDWSRGQTQPSHQGKPGFALPRLEGVPVAFVAVSVKSPGLTSRIRGLALRLCRAVEAFQHVCALNLLGFYFVNATHSLVKLVFMLTRFRSKQRLRVSAFWLVSIKALLLGLLASKCLSRFAWLRQKHSNAAPRFRKLLRRFKQLLEIRSRSGKSAPICNPRHSAKPSDPREY